ncbi:MAG: GNAT family N-acetyltransferase [Actinobacteria bacterium]|nr:GNAT family N-acetyltransferase [Actinomycetota bacterium]
MGFEVPDLRDDEIVLRLPTTDHVDAITAACQDPDIPRFTRVPSPYTRDDAVAFVERSRDQWRDGVVAANFVIEDLITGVLRGACGLHLRDTPEVAEVGYWIAAPARRRGVATRATRLASRWALATFPLVRLELITHPDNVGSQRVAESAGFTREGLLRSYATIGCGVSDVVMFALLPEDLAT